MHQRWRLYTRGRRKTSKNPIETRGTGRRLHKRGKNKHKKSKDKHKESKGKIKKSKEKEKEKRSVVLRG